MNLCESNPKPPKLQTLFVRETTTKETFLQQTKIELNIVVCTL
jgi:hypothetical protein